MHLAVYQPNEIMHFSVHTSLIEYRSIRMNE